MKKNGIFINCDTCGKEIYVSKSRIGIRKYCSRFCKHRMMSKRQKGKLNSYLKEINICGWNKGLKMGPMPKEVTKKRIETLKKNKTEKGYKTIENRRIRNNDEYTDWRKVIFERDNYTCQMCGSHNGNGKTIHLNAHHIKPVIKYPELIIDINNGVTLCKKCHHDLHCLKGFRKCAVPLML